MPWNAVPPVYTPESAAQLYVSSRLGSTQPVSTAEAVRALRTLLIDCKLTDHELAALVSMASVAVGLAVTFDRPVEQSERARA